MWLRKIVLTALAIGIVPLSPQIGTETARQRASKYPEQWPPGPPRSSVPQWAQPGRLRFARWDGGRIETAKAFLSGWPGFNPPIPDYLSAMTNWYDLRTIRLLREAAINTIWVTFSNGFSIPTERAHQQEVRAYIEECHRQGIRVFAYESIANLFWEDMYEHVPEARHWAAIGKDGKPVPYGSGDYAKMGRITRYLADLGNPGWRAYLRKRIDLAVEAGADGIVYDNNFGDQLLDTYQELYRYASGRKPDLLLMGNFHPDTYVLNRILNSITTEDGLEPGLYTEAGAGAPRMRQQRPHLLPVGAGYMVNNIGLFRLHSELSEGWRPVMVEDGGRETGERFTVPISASRHQLALAESMMFGIAMEVFVEGAFADNLWKADPEAMAIWRAIGRYNRFFAENEQYYAGAQSLASIAVVVEDYGSEVALLDGLAARGVIYDVLYARDLSPEKLARYRAVLQLAPQPPAAAQTALDHFSARGGKVIAARPLEELAPALRIAGAPVRVEAPPGVLYHPVFQPATGRTILHLLNYTPHPTGKIKITVEGKFRKAGLISPDEGTGPVRVVALGASSAELEVPQLRIYSLVILEKL